MHELGPGGSAATDQQLRRLPPYPRADHLPMPGSRYRRRRQPGSCSGGRCGDNAGATRTSHRRRRPPLSPPQRERHACRLVGRPPRRITRQVAGSTESRRCQGAGCTAVAQIATPRPRRDLWPPPSRSLRRLQLPRPRAICSASRTGFSGYSATASAATGTAPTGNRRRPSSPAGHLQTPEPEPPPRRAPLATTTRRPERRDLGPPASTAAR